MDLLDVLRSISTGLLGREGVFPLAVALLLNGLFLALSYFLKRKRLSWREGYNSKIGLIPESAGRSPLIESFLATLENVSVLVIRMRNTSRSTITVEDYHGPLRFTFKNRFIIDFRVSKPLPDDIRKRVDEEAYVSRPIDDFGDPPKDTINQLTLRKTLTEALSASPNQDPFTSEEKDARRQLTLPKLELKPKDEFTIAIDLRESTLSSGLESTDKQYACKCELRSGKLVDQSTRSKRVTVTQILTVLCILLLGGLIATIVVPVYSGTERYCVAGAMRVVGSSAFESIADSISKAYMQGCDGASVAIQSNGSLEGIREILASDPSESAWLASLSDGQAAGNVGALVRRPIAILVYSVVVNKAAKIDHLSADQIQGIYQGRYTNWRQLGSIVDLPIRMVSRGASSGSRQTFENYVLKYPENTLSSNSCFEKDRDPTAPIIRCERDSTTQILDEVDRIPGAIGYADAVQVAKYRNISRARLDDLEPTAQYLPSGYPFWTIEYLYTNGVPASGSLLNSYVDYISSDAARSRIHDAGYTPCVQSDGRILDLCQTPR